MHLATFATRLDAEQVRASFHVSGMPKALEDTAFMHLRFSGGAPGTLILDTAVDEISEQRKASTGEAFRTIPATAEQFQMGDRLGLELRPHHGDLPSSDGVNCGC
jgi:hypothetical protein